MTHIGRLRTAVVATSSKPASNGRHGTGTDKGDRFVSHLPFSIELLWGHAKLTVSVEVDEGLLSFGKRTGFDSSSSRGSRLVLF
jgi:hypothetical protein